MCFGRGLGEPGRCLLLLKPEGAPAEYGSLQASGFMGLLSGRGRVGCSLMCACVDWHIPQGNFVLCVTVCATLQLGLAGWPGGVLRLYKSDCSLLYFPTTTRTNPFVCLCLFSFAKWKKKASWKRIDTSCRSILFSSLCCRDQ